RLQRRLFTEDAERGFAFIDLCHKPFDVVLMNPPFGTPPEQVFSYLKKSSPLGYVDLYPAFIARACEFCRHGFVGAITSRSFLMAHKMTRLRESLVLNSIQLILDLGPQVMDDAEVESCAYVLSTGQPVGGHFLACNLRNESNKNQVV